MRIVVLSALAFGLTGCAVVAEMGRALEEAFKERPKEGEKGSATTATICGGCGGRIQPPANFCPSCGQALAKEDPKIEKKETEEKRPLSVAAGVPQEGRPRLQRYESADGKVLAYKPGDWKVTAGPVSSGRAYRVTVEHPDRLGRVELISEAGGSQDSVAFANRRMAGFRKEDPSFRVEKMYSTKERDRTRALVRFGEGASAVRGHLYFFQAKEGLTYVALSAREDRWKELRPLLATVVANLAYAPQGARAALEAARAKARKTRVRKVFSPADMLRAASQRKGKALPMVRAQAADGSFALDVPRGWSFQGAEMACRIYADASRKRHGFAAMGHQIVFPGAMMPGLNAIQSRYLSPAQALPLVMRHEGLGRDFGVLSKSGLHKIDPEAMKVVRLMQAQGFRIEQEVLFVRFAAPDTGEALCGIFYVMCGTYPASYGWTAQVQGCWAPAAEFEDYLPLFFRMSESVALNRAWIQAKMSAQYASALLSQKRMMRSIAGLSRAYDDYNAGWWRNQRTYDYIYWRQSQTTLGRGTWVSRFEGAKVVETYSWGLHHERYGNAEGKPYNTTNFDGTDPWTREPLEEVDTRREWERYVR